MCRKPSRSGRRRVRRRRAIPLTWAVRRWFESSHRYHIPSYSNPGTQMLLRRVGVDAPPAQGSPPRRLRARARPPPRSGSRPRHASPRVPVGRRLREDPHVQARRNPEAVCEMSISARAIREPRIEATRTGSGPVASGEFEALNPPCVHPLHTAQPEEPPRRS